MKKIAIIFVIVLLAVGVIIFKKNQDHFKSGAFLHPDGKVTKDDDFRGPESGAHLNDRDSVFNSLVVSPTNPDVVFVGTENNAFFKSVDGGKTWEWIRKGFWHNERSYPEFYGIVISPDDESMMYAVLTNGPQTPDVEKSAGFYRSGDGGGSWERFVNGLPNTGTTSVAIVDEKRILVGLDGEDPTNHIMKIKGVNPLGGIYVSENNGDSWRAVSIPEKGIDNRYSHIVVRGNDVF
ncbi:WD40/YVTN/BNR-like repeat-containing protein, partial [Patescibacteria group bacterium]